MSYEMTSHVDCRTAGHGQAPASPPPGELVADLQRALQCFDKHQLDEAESLFDHVLRSLARGRFSGCERMWAESLGGLAELYLKKARPHRRSDDFRWYATMLRSAALHDELARYCRRLDDAWCDASDGRRRRWLDDVGKKAERLLADVDAVVGESLQRRVADVGGRRPTHEIAHAPDFVDTAWLDALLTHVRRGGVVEPAGGATDGGPRSPGDRIDSASAAGESSTSTSPGSDADERPPKKLDCERVQRTIMKLVRQISSDIRGRFRRRKLSEEMFRETMSSEMIAKCSPMPETSDVLALFENAIIQYKYGVSPDEFRQWNVEPVDGDSEGTGNETASTDTQSDDQSPAAVPFLPEVCRGETPPDVDGDDDDDSYNLPGVLTVWRAYGRCHSAHVRPDHAQFKPYLLQGFEELSPLTETPLTSSDGFASQATSSGGGGSSTETPPSPEPDRSGYVSEGKVERALARALVQCAERLQNDPRGLNQACELYKYALGILRSGRCEGGGERELTASIFKNVGIIRCTQGDLALGSQLMHESLELFSADGDVERLNVAEVWYELGEAFMRQQWREDTIFEHVMRLVRDELNRDVRLDAGGGGEDADGAGVDDDVASVGSDSSDGGASYCVCAHEALGCYRSALAILSRLRRRRECHTGLYVDVLTKLADCSIVVGEYERAVLCYEEALYLCQNTLGSASLANSAHVLAMLGTTNFLLGVHSKAATMYETASILQRHLYGLDDNFEMAFTLSMLGNTYHVMRHYHKCIAWCMKAYELYVNIYRQEIVFVDCLHRWFITQTLYCLGFAYSTLNFHDKALHSLDLAKNMIQKASRPDVDVRQYVKILKVMADVHASRDENETALGYYQAALDQSLLLGDERSATTLQNQLLNRMAGIHVSAKEYGTAAEYLEQALDCQRNVENSIRGDLMGIMYQLGITYTLSGDIDRAIDCFSELHEAHEEAPGSPGPGLARALGSLGTLYHLKGCMQDDNDDMLEYLETAERYYREAVAADRRSPVCVQYANFLHQQEQYADALLVVLRRVFQPPAAAADGAELRYNGPEQAVLPDHLLHDLNDTEEVVLDARVFARFLGVLCLRQLLLFDDADDCLEAMVADVDRSDVSLNHTMLGYALIEMGLYAEAAESFDAAAALQHDGEVPQLNLWISLCLWAYSVLQRACYHVWEAATESYVDLVGPAPTPTPTRRPEAAPSGGREKLRDSGYYDHADETSTSTAELTYVGRVDDVGYDSTSRDVGAGDDILGGEWHTEEVEDTPPDVLEAILRSRMLAEENTANNNNEVFTLTSGLGDLQEEGQEEWITEEEVTLDTPAVIIAALSGRLTADDPDRRSGYEPARRDSGDELKHKSAPTQHVDIGWPKKQRTVAPPDVLEGLNANYAPYRSDRRAAESGDGKAAFRCFSDANGNGAFSPPSVIRSAETTDAASWSARYDGLNANTCRPPDGACVEPNANAFYDDQRNEADADEVWETFEETIETPPAILAVLLANQNKA